MLTLNQAENGVSVAAGVNGDSFNDFSMACGKGKLWTVTKRKNKRNKFDLERTDGLIPGSIEAIEKMRAMAEAGKDLYTGEVLTEAEMEIDSEGVNDLREIAEVLGDTDSPLFRGI